MAARPSPRPSEQYSPWRKWQILWRSWRKLQVVDLLVVAVLFPLELCCWLCERNLDTLQPWIWYQRVASFLLFRYYFKSVSISDPCGVLEGKLGRRLIFCSNHPTGLLDRLLVQHLCPWCYCLTQNWFEYTNAVERCLHVTQGMAFDHVVQTLRKDAAVWVAVGGAREMHPHIRKVHTGSARIAMQCGDLWLVPMHLAFEAHCQRGSNVLVELGQPLRVSHEDTESHAGRERVRSLTREVEERLLPLTNWMPVSQDDFGKKGWRGAGETRVAIEEWYQVRAIDTLIHLQEVHEGRPALPWPCRVRRLRTTLRRATAEGQVGLPAAVEAVRRYVELLEGHLGASAFQPPCGSFWDLPQSFKALPRAPAQAAPALKTPKLLELRNFAAGVQRHVGGAGKDHPALRAALAELMEASKEFRVAYLDP